MKSASVIEDGRWCQSKSMRNVNHIHCESEMTSTILIPPCQKAEQNRGAYHTGCRWNRIFITHVGHPSLSHPMRSPGFKDRKSI
jgi:hypothetical protein